MTALVPYEGPTQIVPNMDDPDIIMSRRQFETGVKQVRDQAFMMGVRMAEQNQMQYVAQTSSEAQLLLPAPNTLATLPNQPECKKLVGPLGVVWQIIQFLYKKTNWKTMHIAALIVMWCLYALFQSFVRFNQASKLMWDTMNMPTNKILEGYCSFKWANCTNDATKSSFPDMSQFVDPKFDALNLPLHCFGMLGLILIAVFDMIFPFVIDTIIILFRQMYAEFEVMLQIFFNIFFNISMHLLYWIWQECKKFDHPEYSWEHLMQRVVDMSKAAMKIVAPSSTPRRSRVSGGMTKMFILQIFVLALYLLFSAGLGLYVAVKVQYGPKYCKVLDLNAPDVMTDIKVRLFGFNKLRPCEGNVTAHNMTQPDDFKMNTSKAEQGKFKQPTEETVVKNDTKKGTRDNSTMNETNTVEIPDFYGVQKAKEFWDNLDETQKNIIQIVLAAGSAQLVNMILEKAGCYSMCQEFFKIG